MALNIFGDAPQSLTGLLGEQATEDLRKKAMTTGLINAAIGYIAQPKTMGYGSALPYLGRALMAGQQGAQGVYEGAITDFDRQQKISEMQRKQQQREAQEQFLEQYSSSLPENQRAAVRAFPELGAKIAESSIVPKDRKYEKVGNQLIEVSGATPTVAFTGQSETAPTNLLKLQTELDAMPLNDPRRQTWMNMIKKESSPTPPSTVIMTPRQIFQDEQALRKEYSAIPEVKLFGEVQNSYDTIKTSLSKQSPAGDLAGATKFMKLLDPGSVVRESELGMAMAATGALDRAQNYYNMLKTGQKLNPNQRKDFLDLSTQLYQAAENRKSSYDQQYGSIAEQNQLSPSNVVKGFKKQGEWSIREKK
jgi:gluconate kinase